MDKLGLCFLAAIKGARYVVKLGGLRTTDEIVQAFWEEGLYVDEDITQDNFPLVASAAIQEVEIELIDPDCYFSEDEGLEFLKVAGLLRPTKEHALRFAEQHGRTMEGDKDKPYIVLLHEPWQDKDGAPRILVVDHGPYDQGLNLGHLDDGLDTSCMLAGVVPRAPR